MKLPPRIKAIFLFLLPLIVIGGIFFWIYYGDRGTLLLEGDMPDEITGILIGDQRCKNMPCSMNIFPGNYTVIFKKAGYYDVQKNIRIYLFDTTKETLDFRLKPTAQKIGTVQHFTLPVEKTIAGYSDNQLRMSVVQDMYAYFSFPLDRVDQIREISFSPRKQSALIISSAGNYIFREEVLTRVSLPSDSFGFVWSGDSVFYFWQKDKNVWRLFAFDIFKKQMSLEGIFYDLQEGEIIPSSKSIVIRDTNKVYLFDIKTKRRSEILEGLFVKTGKWDMSGSSFLFQTKDGKFFLWNSSRTLEIDNLGDSLSLSQVAFYDDETLVYGQYDENTNIFHFFLVPIEKEKQAQLVFSFLPEKNEPIQKIDIHDGRIYFSLGESVYTIVGDDKMEESFIR